MTTGKITFMGALGYDNAVMELNDICEACYSNASLHAKARSITIQDLEGVYAWDHTTIVQNNQLFGRGTFSYSQYSFAPGIFDLLDSTWAWDDDANKPSPDTRSAEPAMSSSAKLDETGKFANDSPTNNKNRQYVQTLYTRLFQSTKLWTDDAYHDLIIGNYSKNRKYLYYWLASRSVNWGLSSTNFCISHFSERELSATTLYTGRGESEEGENYIRPMVDIPIEDVRLTAGSSAGIWNIAPR